MYQVKFKDFNGPLDLLLKLVEEKNLEIAELSLANVTEDFLNYLNRQELIPAEELADFLVVASTLILIKSKTLLPVLNLSEEEKEEILDLEFQLKLYKFFKETGQLLGEKFKEQKILFPRPIEKIITNNFSPPLNFSLVQLEETYKKLTAFLEKEEPLAKQKIKKIISLKSRIEELMKLFQENNNYALNDLVKNKQNKLEIIMTFLAVLHLAKEKVIKIKQDKNFDQIWILK
ncbi:MAG TPA: segregation/condensation protein A [Candidatus Paceibacterota bacterium]|jgi:segregation and condensation protein A|nr:segregation/condensation protein A [Candidatus Paceibacterota bacterium]HOQ15365.1 segregation/condensation protein A [Candidatus Paceibacterota bacterium]HPQ23020.1 segregation/condensation protein A [Candidatus Paceibacterota bacterium]HRR45818.1 segregation/condensation protein A [Candidatus Paceibacterota bacterium]